jgi:hypothetical protein
MVWYGMGFSNTIPYHGPAYSLDTCPKSSALRRPLLREHSASRPTALGALFSKKSAVLSEARVRNNLSDRDVLWVRCSDLRTVKQPVSY